MNKMNGQKYNTSTTPRKVAVCCMHFAKDFEVVRKPTPYEVKSQFCPTFQFVVFLWNIFPEIRGEFDSSQGPSTYESVKHTVFQDGRTKCENFTIKLTGLKYKLSPKNWPGTHRFASFICKNIFFYTTLLPSLLCAYMVSGGVQHLRGGMVKVSGVFQHVLLLIFEL